METKKEEREKGITEIPYSEELDWEKVEIDDFENYRFGDSDWDECQNLLHRSRAALEFYFNEKPKIYDVIAFANSIALKTFIH